MVQSLAFYELVLSTLVILYNKVVNYGGERSIRESLLPLTVVACHLSEGSNKTRNG